MGYFDDFVSIESFIGKTFKSINVSDDKEQIIFEADDGNTFRMYHEQDCCESVLIEEIIGDLSDLVGSPILRASEESNSEIDQPYDYSESWTWTFYKLSTIKGSVTLRWLGESNGYYSESVDIKKLRSPKCD